MIHKKRIIKFSIGCLLILLLMGAYQLSYATIVNVQKTLAQADQEGLWGSIDFSADYKTGNVELFSLSGDLTAFLNLDPHLILLNATTAYGQKSGDRYLYLFYEHLRYVFKFLPWMAAEVFGQHNFNEFTRLQLRALGGIGPRFAFDVVENIFFITFGTSYMFEYEELSDGYIEENGLYKNHRWNNYLSLVISPVDYFDLVITTYVQPRIFAGTQNFLDDYRIQHEDDLIFKINEWLSIEIAFILSYDSMPPIPEPTSGNSEVKSLDTALTTSISIGFGPWFGGEMTSESEVEDSEMEDTNNETNSSETSIDQDDTNNTETNNEENSQE